MADIIDSIQKQIKNGILKALLRLTDNGYVDEFPFPEIELEAPREKSFGDFSTNIAMKTAPLVKKSPREIALKLISLMDIQNTYISEIQCAGPGFINFYLSKNWLYDAIELILQMKEGYGRLDEGKGCKVMVEFVSANPTGPLHMGNARGGALGDCIAGVLKAYGCDVTKEYYVNDAGNQIEMFGLSLEARYIQELNGEEAFDFPADGYHGDDIRSYASEYIKTYGDTLLKETAEIRRQKLVNFALPKNIEKIRTGLENYGISFDVWFSEQSLYDSGEIDETINYLKEKGYTEEKDGALWFKASWFGTEKDEVLIRSNGIPTYFASDIAYHRNKFLRRGYDRVINLLGADHHGHAARMKAAVKALGISADRLDIVIFQLVRLYRNGEIARMSKRTGKSITIEDLIEETGRDAARFFFNTKAAGSHLDFDIDLAVSQSNENPVYYVQYAHARICSILSLLESEGITIPETENTDLTLLEMPEELELIRKLAEFPSEIRICYQTLEPSRLTRYVFDVAALFHSFYNACRVKGAPEDIMKARILLVKASGVVIRNVLDILSIDAPQRM